MVKLSTQDALFLRLEEPDAPMHIGLLMTCRLPRGAPGDYMQTLHERLSRVDVESEPFNLRLVRRGSLTRVLPALEVTDEIDIDYHLRHEALPWPGGERELGLAISRLHSVPLERSRPLWECTLIEGLRPDRFALYLKVHHALGDGVGLIRKIAAALAESPRGASLPPWAAPTVSAREAPATQSADEDWSRFFQELLASLGRPKAAHDRAPLVPRGPRCVLNGNTTGRRRLATQALSLRRVRAIARAADATVNDVVLAVCSGALRAYLAKFERIPRDSLLVTVPVALPRTDGAESGSAVASIHAPLATDRTSPRERLLAIRDSMRAAKEEFRTLPVMLHRAVSSVGMQLMMLVPKRGKPDPDHATFTNLTISNVPGPRQQLYFEGAEVEGMYPVSVLAGDQRLNISVLSYRERLHFGLVACPDTLPSVQYLALQLPVALRELEAEMRSAGTGRRRRQPATTAAARPAPRRTAPVAR